MQSFRYLYFLLLVLFASDCTATHAATHAATCGTTSCYDGYYCFANKYCCKNTVLPETCAKNNGIPLPSSIKNPSIPTKAATKVESVATNIKSLPTNIKTVASNSKSLESVAMDLISTAPSLTNPSASERTDSLSVSFSVSMNVSIPAATPTTSASSTAPTTSKASSGAVGGRYTAGEGLIVFLGLISFLGYML